MGQRLNISMEKDGNVLANAYYHWSAYTSSAAYLMMQIANIYDDVKSKSNTPVELAVKLLAETGAGFNPEEAERAQSQRSRTWNVIPHPDATSRNDGLISITEFGIEETEMWEEGRVTFDLGEETVSFTVLYEWDLEDFRADYEEELKPGGYYWNKLGESADSFDPVPIAEAYKILNTIETHPVGFINGDRVYTWIE